MTETAPLTTASTTKSKYPIAIFELIANGTGSGFIREDTINSKNPDEIRYPKNRSIINKSVMKVWNEDKGADVNVPISFVYGSPDILESQHKTQGTVKNPQSDRIMFVNGLITVPKDGATVGLYEFMVNHAQNATNENRIKHLTPIFREIKPSETAQEMNVSEFMIAEAVMYIKALVTQQGKGYQFSEERIDALCAQFNIAAESYESKIQSLTYFAKSNPDYFLNEAKKTEQIVLIEVNHALKLKVIDFAGNTAMFVAKNEKIKGLMGNLSTEEKKTAALANWFQSIEGREAYEVFKVELQAAKDKINQQN